MYVVLLVLPCINSELRFDIWVCRGQAEKEFRVEVEAIGHVRHKNLVRLLGYCVEGIHRLAFHTFFCGSLAFHTFELPFCSVQHICSNFCKIFIMIPVPDIMF